MHAQVTDLESRLDSVELGEVCHSQDVGVVGVCGHLIQLRLIDAVTDADTEDVDAVVSGRLSRSLRLARPVGLAVRDDHGNVGHARSISVTGLAGGRKRAEGGGGDKDNLPYKS